MEKETESILISNIRKKENNNKKKEDDFWYDKIEVDLDVNKSNNINYSSNNVNESFSKSQIKNLTQNENSSNNIIIPKNKMIKTNIQKLKMNLNNYSIKKFKYSKKQMNKIKLYKRASEANAKSDIFKNQKKNKLYEDGLISMKKKREKSIEAKIKKENEYKNYSFSPSINTNAPSFKNNGYYNQQKKAIENSKQEEKTERYRKKNIYERNKIWKQNIEEKKRKQIMMRLKKSEQKIQFKPSINDCIMKTDEDFINKNSIEYQAFMDKNNIKKIKENIYGGCGHYSKNFIASNNQIKHNSKLKFSSGLKEKTNINNKNQDNNKKQISNNKKIFDIKSCREKYGLCDFFQNNNNESIINKDSEKKSDLLSGKRGNDINTSSFSQDISKSPIESIACNKQTYFNFMDALLKIRTMEK